MYCIRPDPLRTSVATRDLKTMWVLLHFRNLGILDIRFINYPYEGFLIHFMGALIPTLWVPHFFIIVNIVAMLQCK